MNVVCRQSRWKSPLSGSLTSQKKICDNDPPIGPDAFYRTLKKSTKERPLDSENSA
jgi:hypothetical protein